MADDLDKRFRTLLDMAVQEARDKGMNRIADALRGASDYMLESRAYIVQRLESVGIYSFTEQQYRLMLELVAKATVEKAIEEKKGKDLEYRRDVWGIRGNRIVAITAIGSFILSIAIIAINSFASLLQRLGIH